jgi:phospho-N-acetylmuramoyl-pentapeptide-transferase
MAISLIGTPFLIAWLRVRGIGQPIREEGPAGHITKAGTPTMGGVMIVIGACVGYAIGHVRKHTIFTRAGIELMLAIALTAGVGLIDDWIKVSSKKNLGLNKRAKFGGQLVVATVFAVLVVKTADAQTYLSFTRKDVPGIHLGPVAWVVWAVFVIVAMSNAVNLTDGLDGLAAGSASLTFTAFVVIGFWLFRHPTTYHVPQGLDLGLVAASMLGGCAGFLWWNAAPAQIIMGDTGALAIGTALGGLGLLTNTTLLLAVAGGLFVVETLSVMIQVASFRLFHRRVFKMAPIHHHFELLGWPETTVIVRFWILAGLFTALALGIFYADFLRTGAAG